MTASTWPDGPVVIHHQLRQLPGLRRAAPHSADRILDQGLANAHGDELAETAHGARPVGAAPQWQPLRKVVEEMLVAYDWGESFTAFNLTVKPMLDALVNEELAELAAANGDQFLSQLLNEFNHDSQRSQDWSKALVAYSIDRDPALRNVFDGWLARWQPAAKDAVDTLARSVRDCTTSTVGRVCRR